MLLQMKYGKEKFELLKLNSKYIFNDKNAVFNNECSGFASYE